MKKYRKKTKPGLSLRGWMILECFVVVLGSVLASELTDFATNYVFIRNYYYNPISGIGMIIPMSISVYFITYYFSKTLYRYISELTEGISKISKGEFNVKLDEKSGGLLMDVYHNFNIMSAELSSINQLREDFANEFSHEFKTPLSSINGFSNLLLEGNCSKEEAKKYLSIIAAESERLMALAQSQLLLSKFDSQHIVIDKKEYFLDEQIRRCIILLASGWEKKNLDISIELSRIHFFGNANLLQHVWINLISNAIKYTAKNGAISVSANITENDIEISISDTGVGMTDEQINHIFDKYYRVESSSNIHGFGLGLTIVMRIIYLNNGSIHVKSIPNEGSTFTVILPKGK